MKTIVSAAASFYSVFSVGVYRFRFGIYAAGNRNGKT